MVYFITPIPSTTLMIPILIQTFIIHTTFERILLDGENPNASFDIFWINKDNGVLLRLPNGKELFIDEAISVMGGCHDSHFIVQYPDDTYAVYNSNGDSILTNLTVYEYPFFITDTGYKRILHVCSCDVHL